MIALCDDNGRRCFLERAKGGQRSREYAQLARMRQHWNRQGGTDQELLCSVVEFGAQVQRPPLELVELLVLRVRGGIARGRRVLVEPGMLRVDGGFGSLVCGARSSSWFAVSRPSGPARLALLGAVCLGGLVGMVLRCLRVELV